MSAALPVSLSNLLVSGRYTPPLPLRPSERRRRDHCYVSFATAERGSCPEPVTTNRDLDRILGKVDRVLQRHAIEDKLEFPNSVRQPLLNYCQICAPLNQL